MGRSKKTPTDRRPGPSAASPRDADLPPARRGPKPNPPRPNKLFLAIAIILLVLWISFLAVLAVLAHKWA